MSRTTLPSPAQGLRVLLSMNGLRLRCAVAGKEDRINLSVLYRPQDRVLETDAFADAVEQMLTRPWTIEAFAGAVHEWISQQGVSAVVRVRRLSGEAERVELIATAGAEDAA